MSRLSKEEFLDRTRYSFKSEEVELPELGGSVVVKALSNKRRNEFVDLSNRAQEATGDESMKLAAEALAIAIAEPELTAEEIESVLGDQPATASDRILAEFIKLVGVPNEEEVAETRGDFRTPED